MPRTVHNPQPATSEGSTLVLTVDGTDYPFDLEMIPGTMALAFRKETGLALRTMLGSFFGDEADTDSAAAIMWLSCRQAGGGESYDDLAAKVTYESKVEVRPQDDPPEA